MLCQMPIRLRLWQQARTYASAAPKRPPRFGATVGLDHVSHFFPNLMQNHAQAYFTYI